MIETLMRTAILYIVVIASMRIMGKRQVGELQPSELVVTILISELASIPMQDLDRPIINGIIAILVLVFLEIVLSVISLKFPLIRRMFSGKPAILINNGVVDQQMMKRLRVSIDDLIEGLRHAGVFQLQDVAYAIMETNGKLSIMQRQAAMPVTKSDMEVSSPKDGLPIILISDGKLQKKALETGKVSESEVESKLKSEKLKINQVFLMTGSLNNEFIIIKKDKQK